MYLIDLVVIVAIALFSGYYIHICHVRTCKSASVDCNYMFMNDAYKEYAEKEIREYKRRTKERKKRKIRKGL